MMRIFVFVLSIILAANASAGQMSLLGAGSAGASAPAYTGPGDISSNFVAWWGLSAFSAADRGNRVVRVCDSTGGVDVACADMVTDATTGQLVSQTIGGITCPGDANCTIRTFYDRSGTLACSAGVACDAGNTTISQRPTLASSLGTKTCALFASASSRSLTTLTTSSTYAQPWSMYFVGQPNASTTGTSVFIAQNPSSRYTGYYNSGTNTAVFNAATKTGLAASFAAAHTIGFIANGASSVGSVDGSNTTISAGANTLASGNVFTLGVASGTYANGVFCEGGVMSSDQSSTFASLSSNRKSFWGY